VKADQRRLRERPLTRSSHVDYLASNPQYSSGLQEEWLRAPSEAPERLRPDLETFFNASGVSAIWPDGERFADNAAGRFA
jgi:hypothetical protein